MTFLAGSLRRLEQTCVRLARLSLLRQGGSFPSLAGWLSAQYTQAGSSCRPSACWADVIAARPWVLISPQGAHHPAQEDTAHGPTSNTACCHKVLWPSLTKPKKQTKPLRQTKQNKTKYKNKKETGARGGHRKLQCS